MFSAESRYYVKLVTRLEIEESEHQEIKKQSLKQKDQLKTIKSIQTESEQRFT